MAFLLNLLAGILAFGWSILSSGGLFSVAGDFNVQQIPFAMAANDAIKSGNVIWDWSLDLGSNFIGGMSFYVLGNPSFWLSLLFPSRWFIYLVGWFYVLKYAFAGLTSYAWMSRYVRDKRSAVTASVLYAFSGFMATNLLFYHFHDVVLLFPLMMLTFDRLMMEGKKGPFIFAVWINAIVNYFFFPGEVIFLIAYFLIRYVLVNGRGEWRKVPTILTEAVLGVMLGALLLVPSAIFTMQNPRVKLDYTGSNALVFGTDRYLFILKALIFPGEVMSDQSAVINRNFASCAAYLPMVGLVLVIAFVLLHKKHWLTRMLKFCLVMAVIPILNATFSLFAGLYHRWYYMPVLLFALASALVLDQLTWEGNTFTSPTPAEKAVGKGTLIWLLVTVFFIVYLVFVPWSASEVSKIFRADVFAAWSAVSVGGTILTWLLLTRIRKMRSLLLTLGILAFAVGTTAGAIFLYHIANGEDAVHLEDRLVSAAHFDYKLPQYRFTNVENPETLAQGIQASGNFCSTVSGSIFRFYEGLGLSRDVRSPEAPEGLYQLVSARYTYEKSPRKNETPIQTVKGRYYTYYLYQDEAVPPIGFTYDTYLTMSDFLDTPSADRAILMLKTLIIPDDQEATVAKTMRKYDADRDGEASKEYLNLISSSHLKEASQKVRQTTSSFSSVITADRDKYAFFSIPDDEGWTARVNDRDARIIDVNGMMAVRVSKGTNEISFHYRVPGLKTGIAVTLVSIVLCVLYLVLAARRKGIANRGGLCYNAESKKSKEG